LNDLKGGDLIFPLNRPEYVAVPEGFLSALAWSAYNASNLPSVSDGRKLGLKYHKVQEEKNAKTVEFHYTEPVGARLEQLEAALKSRGFLAFDEHAPLSQAVLNSIRGVKSDKGKQVPASPLSPSLALLQNNVGIAGKANPPDVAEILETMFDLGSMGDTQFTLSSTYVQANETRLARDPLLALIDSAINEVVWGNSVEPRRELTLRERKGINLQKYLGDSPFAWFRNTWLKLMSKEWIEVLPARVWVDWATTALRSIYAMGYLWETTWYEAIAREILTDDTDTTKPAIERIRARQGQPLVWRANSAGAEIRELSSRLKLRCSRAVEVRNILMSWIKEHKQADVPLDACMVSMNMDVTLKDMLAEALNRRGARDTNGNLWEAIRYTLSSRGVGDHYGFFRSHGPRYLFAEPGSEWIAVMASLSAESPTSNTDMGSVARQLALLGASPRQTDLLGYLEIAGLARGSADADVGVIVENAFGGSF